jgi:hypothetical protein
MKLLYSPVSEKIILSSVNLPPNEYLIGVPTEIEVGNLSLDMPPKTVSLVYVYHKRLSYDMHEYKFSGVRIT